MQEFAAQSAPQLSPDLGEPPIVAGSLWASWVTFLGSRSMTSIRWISGVECRVLQTTEMMV